MEKRRKVVGEDGKQVRDVQKCLYNKTQESAGHTDPANIDSTGSYLDGRCLSVAALSKAHNLVVCKSETT